MAKIGSVWVSGSWVDGQLWATGAWTSGAWKEGVWGEGGWGEGTWGDIIPEIEEPVVEQVVPAAAGGGIVIDYHWLPKKQLGFSKEEEELIRILASITVEGLLE